jgi:hypothetical protein
MGLPGVQGDGVGGPGVVANGLTGVVATGTSGPGVLGISSMDRGGVFTTKVRAQICLTPLDASIKTPLQLRGQQGELLVLLTTTGAGRDTKTVATLWFCTESGGPGMAGDPNVANWVKLA